MLNEADAAPRFADARTVVVAALEEMRFPERVLVSEAAKRRPEDGGRVLVNPGAYSGPWADSPHDMRFADRAMDALHADSPFDEVGIEGPSQTAKSEVGNNWALHTILHDPADMVFFMPDKDSIRSYVTTQFTRMLDAQPKLRARQLGGTSSDNIPLKQFRGCDLHFLYPTGPNFRFRPISRGRLDDYDDFPMDVGDQGDPISLLKGRMASFSAFGRTKIYVNSTPKLGDRAGIAAFRAGGTDERWWVDCLACGDPFELDTEHRLTFDRTGTAEEAAASAEVVCPECGGSHRQQDKRALMATGRWVARGQVAKPGGKVEGDIPNTRRLTQRWDGLMGMRTWADIARQWRDAELTYENAQDEGPLKTFFQTVVGKNYSPRGQGEAPISEEALKKRALASAYVLGEVPAGVEVLIASIDQGVDRFYVAVWGFGVGFRAWLIDRFEIRFTMEDERDRSLAPFTRPEDWSVLHPRVLSLTYPLAGSPTLRMKIFNTIVDTGGMDNATDNAFAWWYSMVAGDVGSGRAKLPATAITLVKGGNNPNAKLLPPPTIDAKRQVKGTYHQANLYIPNVNRLKDIADTRLRRGDGGPGSIAFPCDIDQRYVAEMRAEDKVGNQWVRDPHKRNETWDLYIYAYTVVLRFGGSDASLTWVPDWARPPRDRPRPIAPAQQPASAPVVVTGEAPAAAVSAAPMPSAPAPRPTPPARSQSRRVRMTRG